MKRSAKAVWSGSIKEGSGTFGTGSGAIQDQAYSFRTRFDDAPGTNPEELIAAAHASCFTMALAFALSRAGFAEGELETNAKVTLEREGEGFRISRSDLDLVATVPGIAPERFAEIAADAKANCPVSKLLNAEITLNHRLA